MKLNLENILSKSVISLLKTKNHDQSFLTPALISQVTTFNRQQDQAELPQTEVDSQMEKNTFIEMKLEILQTIDRLEQAIGDIISLRRSEEKQAKLWINIVGFVLILLVASSAVIQLFYDNASNSWISSIMSGISVSGLLYILYSPVEKMLEIASDRSSLMLLPVTYRLRVISSSSRKELSAIAKELYDIFQHRDLESSGT